MLSAASLFHFTRTPENLRGILAEGFRVRVSVERMDLLARAMGRDTEFDETGIPMVCFCDIPLSQTAQHMTRYGSYAIGLTKKWGIARSIAPIMYATPTSAIIRSFEAFWRLSRALKIGSESDAKVRADALGSMRLAYFFKPYEDDDRAGTGARRRFYDEREWRYVPETVDAGPEISREATEDPALQPAIEAFLAQFPPLTFGPDDVTHIIVAEDSEIPGVLDAIRQSPMIGARDETLFAKVTTAARIKDDY